MEPTTLVLLNVPVDSDDRSTQLRYRFDDVQDKKGGVMSDYLFRNTFKVSGVLAGGQFIQPVRVQISRSS